MSDTASAFNNYTERKIDELYKGMMKYNNYGHRLLTEITNAMGFAKNDDIYSDFITFLLSKMKNDNQKTYVQSLQLKLTEFNAKKFPLTQEEKRTLKELLKMGISFPDDKDNIRYIDELANIFRNDKKGLSEAISNFCTNVNIDLDDNELKYIIKNFCPYLNDEFIIKYEGKIPPDLKYEIFKNKTGVVEENRIKSIEDFKDNILPLINEANKISVDNLLSACAFVKNKSGIYEEEFQKAVSSLKKFRSQNTNLSDEDLLKEFSKEKSKSKYIPYLPKLFNGEIEDVDQTYSLKRIFYESYNKNQKLNENIKITLLNRVKRIALAKLRLIYEKNKDKFSKTELLLAVKRIMYDDGTAVQNNGILNMIEHCDIGLLNEKLQFTDIDTGENKYIVNSLEDTITPADLMLFYNEENSNKNSYIDAEQDSDNVRNETLDTLLTDVVDYDEIKIVSLNCKENEYENEFFQKETKVIDKSGKSKNVCIIAMNLKNKKNKRVLFNKISKSKNICNKIVSDDVIINDFCREIKETEFYRYTIEDKEDILRKLFIQRTQSAVKSVEVKPDAAGKKYKYINPKYANNLSRIDFSNYTLTSEDLKKILEIAALSSDNFYEFEFEIEDIENLPFAICDYYDNFVKKNPNIPPLQNLRLHIKSSKKIMTEEEMKNMVNFMEDKDNLLDRCGIGRITFDAECINKYFNVAGVARINAVGSKKQSRIQLDEIKNFLNKPDNDRMPKHIGVNSSVENLSITSSKNVYNHYLTNIYKPIDITSYAMLNEEDIDVAKNLDQNLETNQEMQMEVNMLADLNKKPEKTKSIPEKDIMNIANCHQQIGKIMRDKNLPNDIKKYLENIIVDKKNNKISVSLCNDFFRSITMVYRNSSCNSVIKSKENKNKYANTSLTNEAFLQCVKNLIKHGTPRLNYIGQDPMFETFETERGVIVVDTNAKHLLTKQPNAITSMISSYPSFATKDIEPEQKTYEDALEYIGQRYGEETKNVIDKSLKQICSLLPSGIDSSILKDNPVVVAGPEALIYISRNHNTFETLRSVVEASGGLKNIYENIIKTSFKSLSDNIAYNQQFKTTMVTDAVKLCNGLTNIFNFFNKYIKDGFISKKAVKAFFENNMENLQREPQSIGMLFMLLLREKSRCLAEIIRLRNNEGKSLTDIDFENPEEVYQVVNRFPLEGDEKNTIKGCLDNFLLSFHQYPPGPIDLEIQNDTEIFCHNRNVLNSGEDIDVPDKLSIKDKMPITLNDVKQQLMLYGDRDEDRNEYRDEFIKFLVQKQERFIDGRLKEQCFTKYEADLIANRSIIFLCSANIFQNVYNNFLKYIPDDKETCRRLAIEYTSFFQDMLINNKEQEINKETIIALQKNIEQVDFQSFGRIKHLRINCSAFNKIFYIFNNNQVNALLTEHIVDIAESLGANNVDLILKAIEFDKININDDEQMNNLLDTIKSIKDLLEHHEITTDTLQEDFYGQLFYFFVQQQKDKDVPKEEKEKNKTTILKAINNLQEIDRCDITKSYIKYIKSNSHMKKYSSEDILNIAFETINGKGGWNNNKKEDVKNFLLKEYFLDSSFEEYIRIYGDDPEHNFIIREILIPACLYKTSKSGFQLLSPNFINESEIKELKVLLDDLFKRYNGSNKGYYELLKKISDYKHLTKQEKILFIKTIHDLDNGILENLDDVNRYLDILGAIDDYKKRTNQEIRLESVVFILESLKKTPHIFFLKKDDGSLVVNTKFIDNALTVLNLKSLPYNDRQKLVSAITENTNTSSIDNMVKTLVYFNEAFNIKDSQNNIGNVHIIEFFVHSFCDFIKQANKITDTKERKQLIKQKETVFLAFIKHINFINHQKNAAIKEGDISTLNILLKISRNIEEILKKSEGDLNKISSILIKIDVTDLLKKDVAIFFEYLAKHINEPLVEDDLLESFLTALEFVKKDNNTKLDYIFSLKPKQLVELVNIKTLSTQNADKISSIVSDNGGLFLNEEKKKPSWRLLNDKTKDAVISNNNNVSKNIATALSSESRTSKEILAVKRSEQTKNTSISLLFAQSGINLIKEIREIVYKHNNNSKKNIKKQIEYVYSFMENLINDEKKIPHLQAKLRLKAKKRGAKELSEIDQLKLYATFLAEYFIKNGVLFRPEQIVPALISTNKERALIQMNTGTGKTKTIIFSCFNELNNLKTPFVCAPNNVILQQQIEDLKLGGDIGKHIYKVIKEGIIDINTGQKITDEDAIIELLDNENMHNVFVCVANEFDFFKKSFLRKEKGIKIFQKIKDKCTLLQDEADSFIDPSVSNKTAKPSQAIGLGLHDFADFLFEKIMQSPKFGDGNIDTMANIIADDTKTNDLCSDIINIVGSITADDLKRKEIQSVINFMEKKIPCKDLKNKIESRKDLQEYFKEKKNANDSEYKKILYFFNSVLNNLKKAVKLKEGEHYIVEEYIKNNTKLVNYRVIVQDKVTEKNNRFSGYCNFFLKKLISYKTGCGLEPEVATISPDCSISAHIDKYFNKTLFYTATPKNAELWKNKNTELIKFNSVNTDNSDKKYGIYSDTDEEREKQNLPSTQTENIMFLHLIYLGIQHKNKNIKDEKIVKNIAASVCNSIRQKLITKLNLTEQEQKLLNVINQIIDNNLLKSVRPNSVNSYCISIFQGRNKVKNITDRLTDLLDTMFDTEADSLASMIKPTIFPLENSSGKLSMESVKNKINEAQENIFLIGTLEYGTGCDFPGCPYLLNFSSNHTKELQSQIFGRVARSGRYGGIFNYPQFTLKQKFEILKRILTNDNIDDKIRQSVVNSGLKTSILNKKEPPFSIPSVKNEINTLFAKAYKDYPRECYEEILNFNCEQELKKWREYNAIESIKGDFSDKIAIFIAIIENEGLPTDVKNDIINGIELESSNFLDDATTVFKLIEDKDQAISELTKKAEQELRAIVYRNYKIACKSIIPAAEEIKKKTNAVLARIDNEFTNIKTIDNQLNLSYDKDKDDKQEPNAKERLDLNKKAFAKTFLHENNSKKAEPIRISMQNIPLRNDDEMYVKNTLSTIGMLKLYTDDVRDCQLFDFNDKDKKQSPLLFGKTKQTISKNNSLIQDDLLDKTVKYDYFNLYFKSKCIKATKQYYHTDSNGSLKKSKKHIYCINIPGDELTNLDIANISRLAKTSEEGNSLFIISTSGGTFYLTKSEAVSMNAGNAQAVIQKKFNDFKTFMGAFPEEITGIKGKKQITINRAKYLYTKYLLESAFAQENAMEEDDINPATMLENNFNKDYRRDMIKYREKTTREKQYNSDYIIQKRIDEDMTSDALFGYTIINNNKELIRTYEVKQEKIKDLKNKLEKLKLIKKNGLEPSVIVPTAPTLNTQTYSQQEVGKYIQDNAKQSYEQLKDKIEKLTNCDIFLSDSDIESIENNKKLSVLILDKINELGQIIDDLEKEIEESETTYENKRKLLNTLQKWRIEVFKNPEKIDTRLRHLITEATILENFKIQGLGEIGSFTLSDNLSKEESDLQEGEINFENVENIKKQIDKIKKIFQQHNPKNNSYINGDLENNDKKEKSEQRPTIGTALIDKCNKIEKKIERLEKVVNTLITEKEYIATVFRNMLNKEFQSLNYHDDLLNRELSRKINEETMMKIDEMMKNIDKINIHGFDKHITVKNNDQGDELCAKHVELLKDQIKKNALHNFASLLAEKNTLLFNEFSLKDIKRNDNKEFTNETKLLLRDKFNSPKEEAIFIKILDVIANNVSTIPRNRGVTAKTNEDEIKNIYDGIKLILDEEKDLTAQEILILQQNISDLLLGNIEHHSNIRDNLLKKLKKDVELANYINNPSVKQKIIKNVYGNISVNDTKKLNERLDELSNEDLQKISDQNDEYLGEQIQKDTIEYRKMEKTKNAPVFLRIALAVLIIPLFFKKTRNLIFGEEPKNYLPATIVPLVKSKEGQQAATSLINNEKAVEIKKKVNNSVEIQENLNKIRQEEKKQTQQPQRA